ncbi:MAG: cysteine desulfurase-like protein, partial [Anaerolineae bacterium]|nr:cysteine desulfurase-like protein [Anaerolineae bacterium]
KLLCVRASPLETLKLFVCSVFKVRNLGCSRSIGLTLGAGDEIILTRMDHDANVSPWLLMARDHALKVRWVDWDTESGRLNMQQMADVIDPKTKLVACTYASNALGTINDAAKVVEMAHMAGALAYIDAVHYAPHGPIDVQALNCDFLVCSAYKFFGPHVGVLYAKEEHLENLPAYKVRPAPDAIPERWETGTQNHEGLAGVTAAVDYLAWVGEELGGPFAEQVEGYTGRRRALKAALLATQNYERTLSKQLLDGLEEIDEVTMAGITGTEHLEARTPTVVFNIEGQTPLQVATELGEAGIYVWDGNYYALEVMQSLGREEHGGMVRVGAAHYNTHEEIARFLDEVKKIAKA